MKYADKFQLNSQALDIAKNLGVTQNVSIRVIDRGTGKVVSEHTGHNTATNSLLTGIGHYLTGEGVYNQGYEMLHRYVPLYISLGTMGLTSQEADEQGLPKDIGCTWDDLIEEEGTSKEIVERWKAAETAYNNAIEEIAQIESDLEDAIKCPSYEEMKLHCIACCDDESQIYDYCKECVSSGRRDTIQRLSNALAQKQAELPELKAEYESAYSDAEQLRYEVYLDRCPGFGSDGSAPVETEDVNFRKYHGIGPEFKNRPGEDTVDCELISATFPRCSISYREVVPEYNAEFKNTIDIIFSAMISTGALKQFRAVGKDYVFITEAGLWSSPEWSDSGENGLLAGYRIVPPDRDNWDMSKPENREILKRNILRVGVNQVVQVVWKIQIGGVDEFEGMRDIFDQKQYQDADSLLFGHIPTHYPLQTHNDDTNGG